MDIAITIGIVLLFVGGIVAVVVFAVKQSGWRASLLYLLFAVIGRILVHFMISDASPAIQNTVPFVGALVLVWLWPHVLAARNADRMPEVEADAESIENDDPNP